MIYTIGKIAEILNGRVVGDSNFKISMLSKIEEGSKGSLSFLANEKYEDFLYTTKASAVIVNSNLDIDKTKVSTNLIIVEDAYQSFAFMLDEFSKSRNKIEGIHKTASIEESASLGKKCFIGSNVHISDNVNIGDNVKIYPNSYIGENTIIGNDTILYSGVKIYDHCSIGEKCFIQSGAIIGGDGFGFAPNADNEYTKVSQIGNVIIENNVEIGANTTIDRATMGSTIIRQGVKLDNLIQIAHNVEIGKNTVIAAQSGVAGSTKIGENCMIGGQVGIVGHLKIGDNVKIAAQSGIQSDIKDNEIVQGSPAFSISDYKRAYVYFRQLPKLNSLVNRIEKEVNKILSK
jgi:UDP-3-O-[3-hydroxymyristoyl] glucosamine N-acyltransferase